MGIGDLRKDKAFWVAYRVSNASGEDLAELALSSVFPAGWEIASQRVGDQEMPEWVRNLGPQSGKFMEIGDDRVKWLSEQGSGNASHFAAMLNPTSEGEYTRCRVVLEAMYGPLFVGHLAGGTVVVK